MSKQWIQKAAKSMERRGTKGSLTAAAKKRGMDAMQFARYIKAHPDNFSPAMRKKANFAINANK